MIDRHSLLCRFLLPLVLCCSISTAGVVHGQDTAAPTRVVVTAIPAPQQPGPAPPAERDVSWQRLPANILYDQKDIWLFPVELAHGRHWLPTLAVVGVTAGLVALDAHDAPYFRRTSSFRGFNRSFSGTATGVEIALVPASLYTVGFIRKDAYTQKTALWAGEAVADSLVLSTVMKAVTRRLRPSDIAPQGNFSDTFFHSHSLTSNSFPSGHTIAAFSVATVVAERYRSHRWVPWVAYGVAGVIGFSRLTTQAHFPSDVFLGAALGYAISRFDVMRNQ
jgi:membrane-associated phospholipid phosphatase